MTHWVPKIIKKIRIKWTYDERYYVSYKYMDKDKFIVIFHVSIYIKIEIDTDRLYKQNAISR